PSLSLFAAATHRLSGSWLHGAATPAHATAIRSCASYYPRPERHPAQSPRQDRDPQPSEERERTPSTDVHSRVVRNLVPNRAPYSLLLLPYPQKNHPWNAEIYVFAWKKFTQRRKAGLVLYERRISDQPEGDAQFSHASDRPSVRNGMC